MFSFCIYVREINYKNLCLYKFIKSQKYNLIGKGIFSTNGAGTMDIYKKRKKKSQLLLHAMHKN